MEKPKKTWQIYTLKFWKFYFHISKYFAAFVTDSPYHDVSGLPDPYGEHHQAEGEENKTQHMALSFDESLESGYSTPNSRSRRIIREIIVWKTDALVCFIARDNLWTETKSTF